MILLLANKQDQAPRVRKRKWGSTRSAAKKSSITISTDSLKVLPCVCVFSRKVFITMHLISLIVQKLTFQG